MRLLSIERTALIVTALLLASCFFHDPLYRSLWILLIPLVAILWIVALLLTPFSLYWAFADPGSPGHKVRRALAMPLAILATILLAAPAGAAGRWTLARIALMQHRDVYEARAAEMGGRPVAFPYLEGIPDGGAAIVRAAVDPARLPVPEQLALVGEDIHRCMRLDEQHFICAYD